MKLISWNVNGLRACLKKGFGEYLAESGADIFCVQETKMQEGQAEFDAAGYLEYYNYAEKKGYSGTGIFTKTEPLNVIRGIGAAEHDSEGRVLTLEYPEFFIVNVYTPNSQRELARLPYRMQWEDAFREYLSGLAAVKKTIVCGDMNVAHKEIDLKNYKTNTKNAGFTPEERSKFTALLESGFTDTFRHFYPDREGAYTWWSYMFNARTNNTGWRIDYFLVSNETVPYIKDAAIYPDVQGSDHCPVGLILEL